MNYSFSYRSNIIMSYDMLHNITAFVSHLWCIYNCCTSSLRRASPLTRNTITYGSSICFRATWDGFRGLFKSLSSISLLQTIRESRDCSRETVFTRKSLLAIVRKRKLLDRSTRTILLVSMHSCRFLLCPHFVRDIVL